MFTKDMHKNVHKNTIAQNLNDPNSQQKNR